MDILTQILFGFCLATDAFAVSITNGMCSCKINKKNVMATALTFGVFQGLMPVLGYILGHSFANVISRYQHYLALFLLSAIGINMIVDALKDEKEADQVCNSTNIFTVKNLTIQGIATSIDALAVGVSLVAVDVNIASISLIIGIITFLCCALGVYIGRRFGLLLGIRAKLAGGILLVLIGIKIFVQHIVS